MCNQWLAYATSIELDEKEGAGEFSSISQPSWQRVSTHGSLDPFHVPKTAMDLKMQFYFQYCKLRPYQMRRADTRQPVDNTLSSPSGQKSRLQSVFQSTWESVTTIDPAVLYTFIAIGAAQIGVNCWGSSIAAPKQDFESSAQLTEWDALIYRTRAVQHITDRLADPAEELPDSSIVPISVVMMTEVNLHIISPCTMLTQGRLSWSRSNTPRHIEKGSRK